MYIFNRWGEQLFYSDDINVKWDGRFNGNICPVDVYVYRVEYADLYGKKYVKYGNATLIK
jgi:gliding motility-associated-like protein